MCSISGASFAPGSTINRYKLAHGLLKAGESRGRDAAGYGWVRGDDDGIYRNAVKGGQLSLANMPQDADAFISHTRAATQGPAKDMSNNHPVRTPLDRIRLVHNGIIYNDDEVRDQLGDAGIGLAKVDSSVIPALLEAHGPNEADIMQGYAACAWFDRDTGNTLHLARFKQAPVAYVQAYDGSFVFASTADILVSALSHADVRWFGSYPKPIEELREGDYWQVIGGEVVNRSEVPWSVTRSAYQSSYYQNFSKATEGGQSMALSNPTGAAKTSPTIGAPAAAKPTATTPNATTSATVDTGYTDTDDPATASGQRAVAQGLLVRTNGQSDIIFDANGKFDRKTFRASDPPVAQEEPEELDGLDTKRRFAPEIDPVTDEGDSAIRAGGYVMSNGDAEIVFDAEGKFLGKFLLPTLTENPQTVAGRTVVAQGGVVETDGVSEFMYNESGSYLGATKINEYSVAAEDGAPEHGTDNSVWDDGDDPNDTSSWLMGTLNGEEYPVDDPNYYVTDHAGDESTYYTLTGLVSYLQWTEGLVLGAESKITPDGVPGWANHIRDIGSFGADGEYESWVQNPGLLDMFETQLRDKDLSVSYVRDGLAFLGQLVSA